MRDRYPLSWPTGWKRTKARDRRKASFSQSVQMTSSSGSFYQAKKAVTVTVGLQRLLDELRRLGVAEGDCVISTNVPTRLDGLPYSTAKEPDDPGVAVYFRLTRQDRVLACDAWTRVADNVTAIAQHIDALRRIDRYGVGTLEQAFAGYQALPSKGTTWRTTLGFPPDAPVTREEIDRAFKARAREAHPDVDGGSHDAMASLSVARDEALAALADGGSSA
jgi:hypothetical protein